MTKVFGRGGYVIIDQLRAAVSGPCREQRDIQHWQFILITVLFERPTASLLGSNPLR